MTPRKPIVVAGDGWSALAAVGFLAAGGTEVRWIAGNGSRVLSPLPGFRAGAAAGGWRALAEGLGLELGEAEEGSFLREFRGKGFRQLDDPSGSRSGSKTLAGLWAPERRFVPGSADAPGCRFALTAAEIEERVRARLSSGDFKCLRRVQGLEISAVRIESGALRAVVLASGEEIECERLIFADRWSGLGAIQGIPKAPGFARKREPVGVLQATFMHEPSLGAEFTELREGFFGPLQREAGEELERHVWGYFSSSSQEGEAGALRSYWTICLAPEEAEDNHEIAKRLRRLKSALGKMFAGLPGSSAANDFLASVRDEQVRFEESLIFAGGEPVREAFTLPSCPGVEFVTDGYGPSAGIIPIMKLLGVEVAADGIGDAQGAHAQAEDADRAGASAQD